MPGKYQVRITRSAQRDLEEIWSFLHAESPAAAAGVVLALEAQIATLEALPLRCPSIPENEILGTAFRHLIHGNYRTVFRIKGKIVLILRIIHGSRLLDASLFESVI